jgi:hypothetical protein
MPSSAENSIDGLDACGIHRILLNDDALLGIIMLAAYSAAAEGNLAGRKPTGAKKRARKIDRNTSAGQARNPAIRSEQERTVKDGIFPPCVPLFGSSLQSLLVA